MVSTTKKTGGIKDMDRKYFREIFNLHAIDEKINYEGLCKIFAMVDFKPNEKQEVEFKNMFTKKEFLENVLGQLILLAKVMEYKLCASR